MTQYFSIPRIKAAIEHLSAYSSKSVLVPLVLAANDVNSQNIIDINDKKANGGDKFLNRYFHGSLIGFPAYDNGVSTLRPAFKELKASLVAAGHGNDLVYHRNSRLWANEFSSRGYREWRQLGALENIASTQGSHFKLTNSFQAFFEDQLPDSFRFEELLVWLYAFSGFPDEISSWIKLANHFQDSCLGIGKRFNSAYQTRLTVGKTPIIPWPTDIQSIRPSDGEFQRELLPSRFVEGIDSERINDLRNALNDAITSEFQGFSADETAALSAGAVTALLADKRLFLLGDPGVGKSKFSRMIADCFIEVFSEERVFVLQEEITDRTTPENILGFSGIGGDWIDGSITAKRNGRALLYDNSEIDNPKNRNQINLIILDEANRRDIESLLARLQLSIDSQSLDPKDRSHTVALDSAGVRYLSPFTYFVMTGNSPKDDHGRIIQSRPFRRRPGLILMPNPFEKILVGPKEEFVAHSINFWEQHCQRGLLISTDSIKAFTLALNSDADILYDLQTIFTAMSKHKCGVSFGLLEKLFRNASMIFSMLGGLAASIDQALFVSISPMLSTDAAIEGTSLRIELLDILTKTNKKYPQFNSIVANYLSEGDHFGNPIHFF